VPSASVVAHPVAAGSRCHELVVAHGDVEEVDELLDVRRGDDAHERLDAAVEVRCIMSALPMYTCGSPSFANAKMRECSR
jgi:hypothetical protein